MFNIDVDFAPEAVEYVAEISENRKTGDRTLVSVWENILTDLQFELPGSNFIKLEVTRGLCEHPKDYLLRMLEKSPFVDFMDLAFYNHILTCLVWARGSKVRTNGHCSQF